MTPPRAADIAEEAKLRASAHTHVVLYPSRMGGLAKAIAASLPGCAPAVCTDLASSNDAASTLAVAWDRFPSGDPDLKLNADLLIDKHVVLLLNQDDDALSFPQLSLLLFLQRFALPDALAESAASKWKGVVERGTFAMRSVASISVVIPWYRFCQMERVSRWDRGAAGKWTNKEAHGPYVDVPTAHTFAALLSAAPPPPPGGRRAPAPPPMQLLLIDLHETAEVGETLDATGRWANARRPYDLVTGTGTYFVSALNYFLAEVLPVPDDVAYLFVVFPDAGAYGRFCMMVLHRIPSLARDHVLYLSKTRVGASIAQSDQLLYVKGGGEVAERAGLPDGAQVLIVDDFTNSGSTLFGGAAIVKQRTNGTAHVSAYVSHFVAKYDKPTVSKFVEKLYDPTCSLDFFYTTDSNPQIILWLEDELASRADGQKEPRAKVIGLGPLIGAWLRENPLRASPLGALDALESCVRSCLPK